MSTEWGAIHTKVCDLPRVMRLPGYLHMKGQPFRSRLLLCDPMNPWNWPDFAEAMGLLCAATRTDAGQYAEGERNASMYGFACKLRRQGLDSHQALHRVKTANASRCVPPLDAAEVEGIVSSAWRGEPQGFVKLPHSLLDSPEFLNLPDAGKLVLIALIHRHDGSNNGRLALTCVDALAWKLDRRRRRNGLRAAEDAGLLVYMQRSMPASVGRPATPDLFSLPFLSDRGQIDP